MEKIKWNAEISTAQQMKNLRAVKAQKRPPTVSKNNQKESVMSPSSPKTSGKSQTERSVQRYWDEGRVLKVGFLLVFVRAFARLLLKGLGTFTPVVAFLFFIILGGLATSTLETLQRGSGAPETPQTEVIR